MIRANQQLTYTAIDSFNKFEKFFDLSADLLCVAGFDGYFKRINPAVSALLGYSQKELLERPINDFVFQEDKQATKIARDDLRKEFPCSISKTDTSLRKVLSCGYYGPHYLLKMTNKFLQ